MSDKLDSVVESPYFVPAVVGAVSFIGGLGVGFLLGKRKKEEAEVVEFPTQRTFDEELEDLEIDVMEATQAVVPPPKVVIDREQAAEKGIIKVNDLSDLRASMIGGDDDEVQDVPPEPGDEVPFEDTEEPDIVVEVTNDIEWDWELEVQRRNENPGAPYILHREEFERDELSFAQIPLTYYAGDDKLADDKGGPIYNASSVVGRLEFGHGSGDSDVVFIRNEELRAEYEVSRHPGFYDLEVLGIMAEEEAEKADHVAHSKPLKFRME